jgi:hypothetical protein
MRTMRKLLVASAVIGALGAVSPAHAQDPVPRHFHLLTTPSGETHTIAKGLTTNAPCGAFLNFHGFVHTEVFGAVGGPEGMNPLGPLGANVPEPREFCP